MTNALSNVKNADFAATLGSMHGRNMTQLPAGGRYPLTQQIIEGLDTSTKIDLLRSSVAKNENISASQARASLEQIKEKLHCSTSKNPLGMENSTAQITKTSSPRIDGQGAIFVKPD